jgi:glucoside 3-dehydrogenase (cytochrome c) hitch-hiker subunit
MKERPQMNRRELLQQVAWLMGGAVSTPAVLAVLNGCSRKPGVSAPLVLDEGQRAIIAEVAEIIIPRTDTPGAKDADVPRFIESMLQDAFSSEEQQSFISGLQDFAVAAQRAHGKPFLQLSESQRVAFARKLHDDIVAEAKARQKLQRGWRKLQEQSAVPVGQLRAIKKRLRAMVGSQAQRPTRSFILTMKELTLLGYFTSEVGATQILQYLPVPGRQQGCIPLHEAGNGKTWALETSYRF